jgi:hypothetical protein
MTEMQIQNKLLEQYSSNMEFLKNNDIELYNKLETLSYMIEKGLYQEKFVLEFLQETNNFDILNLETELYLYNKEIDEFSKNELNKINLDNRSGFFNLNKNLFTNNNLFGKTSDLKFSDLNKTLSDEIKEYVNIWGEVKEDKKYEKIDKFIFLGNLLGSQIIDFYNKINFKCCFIYEPNLEIFRLSLFTTNYMQLSKNIRLIFSIMDDDIDMNKKIDKFIGNTEIFSNYVIKYYKMNYINDRIFQIFLNQMHLHDPLKFDYTKSLYHTFDSISKHIGKYRVLTLKNKKDFIIDKNILFLAAGPSLDNNIDFIKENQEKFIIITIGAVYKKLFENGIIPDVVTTVDPQYDVLNSTYFNTEDVKLLENTIIFASINTPTKILERFNQEKLFLYEVLDSFKINSNEYFGVSIGEISLSLILDLNFKNIYLLGTDLSINQITGESHFSNYINKRENYTKEKKVNNLKQDNYTVEDFIEVKGNTSDKVITKRIFALSIIQYVEIINKFKKNFQTIYNLSKDGAYIEGTTYKNFDEIVLNLDSIDKSTTLNELILLSELGLTKQEKIYLKENINNLKNLKHAISKLYITSLERVTLREFKDRLLVCFKEINKNNDKFLDKIILNYSKIIISYIFYSINDKEIQNIEKEKKLAKSQKLFYKQIQKILDVYLIYLLKIK